MILYFLVIFFVDVRSLVLKVGLLFPRNASSDLKLRFGYETSASAVLIAHDRIKSENLLRNYTITFIWRYSNCDEGLAASHAFDLFEEQQVHTVIGPPCDLPAVITSVIAKHANLPVLSWAATAYALGDKGRFPTVIRTIGSAIQIGRAIKELFTYFGWHRVALFYTDDGKTRECRSIAHGLSKDLPKNNILIVFSAVIDRKQPTVQEMDRFFSRLPQFARISIVCIEDDRALRVFMLRAHDHGLTDDEYVYLIPDYIRSEEEKDPWIDKRANATRNAFAKHAFHSAIFVDMLLSTGEELHFFKNTVPMRMKNAPFRYRPAADESHGSHYSPFLHDAMYLYALALNKTISQGHNIRNGTAVVENTKSTQFNGMSGVVAMDTEAGRQPVFATKTFDTTGRLRVVAHIELFKEDSHTVQLQLSESIIWSARSGHKPTGTPRCGWFGELCADEDQAALSTPAVVVVVFLSISVIVLMVVAVTYIIKRRLLAAEMSQMLWKVQHKDVMPLRKLHSRQHASFQTITTNISEDMQDAMLHGYENTAQYKGMIVWMKKHHGNMVFSSKQDHLHMKILRDVSHENLNYFVGLCLELRVPMSLWMYCAKGSLYDILSNESILLDWFFKFSFIKDLAMALEVLHESGLVTHGNLKSSNCLVDNRWVLKVTDYGLHMLRGQQSKADIEQQLWRAPELLRQSRPPLEGTQKGDIYGFGIIVSEVLTRDKPFASYSNFRPEDLITKILRGEDPPFRPDLEEISVEDSDVRVVKLMQDCWEENSVIRPSITDIVSVIKVCSKGKSTNLMDHALKMMETYAKNLEAHVKEQTKQLYDETYRSDALLKRMLPQSVVEKLKRGADIEPESYESVTVFFSDVSMFAELTSRSEPMQIVTLLNQLYTLLDEIIEKYDVYKVETINDSYMVVSGLPHRNGDQHAAQIADMALHFQLGIASFYVPHMPQEKLQLRIGMHTGSVVAGVVGLTMPRYCLFGDTVNVASRIETNGKASCIHISDDTFKYLTEIIGGYLTKPRGEIIVKGKGVMYTHWLLGKSTNIENVDSAEDDDLD